MKPEVGISYQTRDGRRADIHQTAPDAIFFKVFGTVNGEEHRWDDKGIVSLNTGKAHALDLISEWPTETGASTHE